MQPKKPMQPLEIGWEEWVALPELKLPAIRAKVDTGAKTSALHAFMVEKIIENEDVKVRFGIHPIPNRPEIEVYCVAHLVDEREIISSNGQAEIRYVIRTLAQFGKRKWPIEITLTDRETMAYRMLIGRSAMEGRLLVVPGQSFLLGDLSKVAYAHIPHKRPKRSLNICILSTDRNNYATDRLASIAENRGHKIEVIDTTRCYVSIRPEKPALHYKGKVLPRYDSVIPRIETAMTAYGIAILRQFEALGIFSLNRSMSIAHSRDRLFMHQLLSRAGISMPTTLFAHYPGSVKDMIRIVGGAPLVIKLLDGHQGKGAILAETNKAAQAVMQTFKNLKTNFIAQSYVKYASSKDIHCVVLGNKVIGAILVAPSKNGLGREKIKDRAVAIKMTKTEKNLAVKAARILGLKFAMVNFLRTQHGPKIIDVDPSPGHKIMESVTGIDMALLVIEYLENHSRPRLPKRIVGL